MKFEDKSNEVLMEECNEIRFNSNTFDEGKIIGNKESKKEKRLFGSATILSLMTMSGYYDEAASEDNLSSYDIVHKMIENASKKIGKEIPESQEIRGRI